MRRAAPMHYATWVTGIMASQGILDSLDRRTIRHSCRIVYTKNGRKKSHLIGGFLSGDVYTIPCSLAHTKRLNPQTSESNIRLEAGLFKCRRIPSKRRFFDSSGLSLKSNIDVYESSVNSKSDNSLCILLPFSIMDNPTQLCRIVRLHYFMLRIFSSFATCASSFKPSNFAALHISALRAVNATLSAFASALLLTTAA